MRRNLFFFVFFAFALCFCAVSQAAQAQATRTWVSGTGDDANPCSRTAPCKTFAGAISKTAAGGEIDALDPGGFGTLTITKAITIDGGGGQVASILAGPGSPGVTVNAGSNDTVVLQNLRIQGVNAGTNGINFLAGLNLKVEHCVIENFTNVGIDFESTSVARLDVVNSLIEGNAQGGLIVATTAAAGKQRATVVRSSFINNAIQGTTTGFGIKSGTTSRTVIFESTFSGNGDAGVLSDGSDSVVTVSESMLANGRSSGIHARNNGIIVLNHSTVIANNGTGLLAESGGQILSYGNNAVNTNIPDGSSTSTIPPQ